MIKAMDSLQILAEDQRRGATAIARRVAPQLARLETKREVLTAARMLLRAKPAMAPLWHLCSIAYLEPGSEELATYARRLEAEQISCVRNVRWLGTGKSLKLVTWSDSETLADSVAQLAPRVDEVRCGLSEPGGEGRRLAARLRRRGIRCRTFVDADVSRALEGADLALMGADATGSSIANKVGSKMLASVARAAGVPVFVIAPSSKLLPEEVVIRVARDAFESLSASDIEAVITESGPRGLRWLTARGENVEIPARIRALVR